MLDRLLEGIRIIDFSTGRFGGYATMLLADFGADVIKVENIKTGGEKKIVLLENDLPDNY